MNHTNFLKVYNWYDKQQTNEKNIHKKDHIYLLRNSTKQEIVVSFELNN